MTERLRVRWLGRVRYPEAYALQHAIFDQRVRDATEDYLLLLEHSHTYTLGRNADARHLLRSPEQYAAAGADVVEVDRGGDVTYHGPGQLVAYPIMRLAPAPLHPDVVAHVRRLETVVIRTLADFGIVAHTRHGFTGVWTESGKIASIGCRITRGVSMHGTAINVDTDQDRWAQIVPCGIQGCEVTSMRRLGSRASTLDVAHRFVFHAADVFERDPDSSPSATAPAVAPDPTDPALRTGTC